MSSTATASNTTAPTQILQVSGHSYAYRRFGNSSGLPLLCLQHFTGTLDNWDPAVSDPLASRGEVILFDNAGIGRSSGEVPETAAGMAAHVMAFLDGLHLDRCDVLGFSLGGMVAQQMAKDRPSIIRRMILVGTAPRGGEDIMHLEKPSLAKHLQDPRNTGYSVLQRIFFAPTSASQAAGEAFIARLMQRKDDRDPPSGPNVAYIQHNPTIPNGRDAIAGLLGSLPDGFRYEPGMVAAEGNIVMIHGRYVGWAPEPMVAVDIFRVENGRLVEHWDVMQAEVPAHETKSKNAMFTS